MRGFGKRRRMHLIGISAVAAAALVLSACSSAVGNGKHASVTTTSSCGKGNITLTVWSYYVGTGQLDALKKQDALFKAKCPNVTVKQVQLPGAQLDPKLLATASTHSGPDVLLNNVVVDFPELQAAGVLADMTAAWNSFADKSQFPKAGIWRGPDNKIYTVMSYTNLLGLYYNKTILDQYHLSPPTTVTEMEHDMQVVTSGGKYKGLAESGTPEVGGAWLFMPLLLSQGINYCNYSGPKVAQAFARVANWVKQGWLPKDAATWNQNDAWQEFMTGKFAFGLNGNWNLAAAQSDAKFSYGTEQFPSDTSKHVVFPGGEGLAIGAFTKHPDVAWQYLLTSWLSRPGGAADFTASGQIPTRSDVASDPAVTADHFATPFVQAAKDVGHWPNNPKTAQAQNAIGKAISSVISGQSSPDAAASQSESAVKSALQAGGGGC